MTTSQKSPEKAQTSQGQSKGQTPANAQPFSPAEQSKERTESKISDETKKKLAELRTKWDAKIAEKETEQKQLQKSISSLPAGIAALKKAGLDDLAAKNEELLAADKASLQKVEDWLNSALTKRKNEELNLVNAEHIDAVKAVVEDLAKTLSNKSIPLVKSVTFSIVVSPAENGDGKLQVKVNAGKTKTSTGGTRTTGGKFEYYVNEEKVTNMRKALEDNGFPPLEDGKTSSAWGDSTKAIKDGHIDSAWRINTETGVKEIRDADGYRTEEAETAETVKADAKA